MFNPTQIKIIYVLK